MKQKYETIINDFYYEYWYVIKDFGLSDFLQLLQLEVLNNHKDLNVKKVISMAYNEFGYTSNRELYKKYIAMNKTGKIDYFTMDEYDNREQYINEAIKWIHRLNMEELRDIIYHHKLRDIQDNECSKRTIEQDFEIKWDEDLVKNIMKKNETTKQIIKEISNEYECYVYTAFNDNNDDLFLMKDVIGYDDKYACCIEVFSDLVDPSNYKKTCFGLTDDYFDDIIEVRDNMRQIAMEIEYFYKQENIKVTLSKWNQGCQFGMTMYIWIPYQ